MYPKRRAGRGGRGAGDLENTRRETPDDESEGECVCSNCGHRIPHQVGKPCRGIICPNCGSQMVRRG
jgi:hypothetical protein